MPTNLLQKQAKWKLGGKVGDFPSPSEKLEWFLSKFIKNTIQNASQKDKNDLFFQLTLAKNYTQSLLMIKMFFKKMFHKFYKYFKWNLVIIFVLFF